jgi:hypothetical protein
MERSDPIISRSRIAIDGIGDKFGAGGRIVGIGGGCLCHTNGSAAEAAADRP